MDAFRGPPLRPTNHQRRLSRFLLLLQLPFLLNLTRSECRRSHKGFLIPDEHRLVDFLFNRSTDLIMAERINRQITVTIAFRLNQIVGLDERQQVMTTNLKIEQRWSNKELRWNPADFGGVHTLRISSEKTWLPDTFIFNNADDMTSGFLKSTYVLIKHNGIIYWPCPVKLKTSCTVRISMFPFDAQNCSIQLGSWIHSVSSLRYQANVNDSLDITRYTHNSEWILSRVELRREPRVSTLNMYSEMQEDVVIRLHIRRRSFFYIWNIIVPCVMLSFLTLLLFWTPTQSGEKISLGLSIFLAYSMFMLLIAEQIPPTSEHVPLIGIYLTVVMSLTASSVIMAVLVVNLSSRAEVGPTRPPVWLRRMTKALLGPQLANRSRTFVSGGSNSIKKSRLAVNLRQSGSRRSLREFEKRKSRRRSDRLALWLDIEQRFRQLALAELCSQQECEACCHGDGEQQVETCRCLPAAGASWCREEHGPRSDAAIAMEERTLAASEARVQKSQAKEAESLRAARIKRDWYLVTVMVDRILFFFFLFLTVAAYVVIFSIPGENVISSRTVEDPVVS